MNDTFKEQFIFGESVQEPTLAQSPYVHLFHELDDLEDIQSNLPEKAKKYFVLEDFDIIYRAQPLPKLVRQGIYFLINKSEEIEYIGQSVNLYARLGRQHEKLKPYHKVAFFPVSERSYLNMVEEHYIKKFKPKLNIKHNMENE